MRGATLIDAVVAAAIFIILFSGFFALMQVGIKTVGEHKARAGALALSRSHIEYIRSLDYTSVGLSGGNPSGVLQSSLNETLNNTVYTITTTVSWRDDPKDGTGGGDSNTNDYKAVKVVTSWDDHGEVESATLSTYVADFNAE